jgi:hypothetical protein
MFSLHSPREVTVWKKQKVDGVPSGVHRPVEAFPTTLDLDAGFVDAVGLIGGFQVRAASLLELGSVALDPPEDRSVIDDDTTRASISSRSRELSA